MARSMMQGTKDNKKDEGCKQTELCKWKKNKGRSVK
jgi:hypothetical protein